MISKSLISMKYICLQIWGDYTSTLAGIYHKSCKEECPNQCKNEWKFVDGNKWKIDNYIKIRCGKIFRCDMILFVWFIFLMNVSVYWRFYFSLTDTIVDDNAESKTPKDNGKNTGMSFFITGFVILVIGFIFIIVLIRLL